MNKSKRFGDGNNVYTVAGLVSVAFVFLWYLKVRMRGITCWQRPQLASYNCQCICKVLSHSACTIAAPILSCFISLSLYYLPISMCHLSLFSLSLTNTLYYCSLSFYSMRDHPLLHYFAYNNYSYYNPLATYTSRVLTTTCTLHY